MTGSGASGAPRPRPRPRKRFGQHFLEPAWVTRLVGLIAPAPGETILEIGPGRGAITRPLAASGAALRVVEVDRDLAAALAADLPQATVICANVLNLGAEALLGGAPRARVVGNLPYNLSTPILFRLLDLAASTGRISDATLMLQREVAERIVAGPGSGEYGPLAIATAMRADCTRLLALPPGAFRPPPKVHSSVIRLTFRDPRLVPRDERRFTEVVRTVFQQRRKTMANALRPLAEREGLDSRALLMSAAIDPGRRPESLALPELIALSDCFPA